MAEGETLTEELAQIKIQSGVMGIISLIIGLKLVACGIAAMALHDLTFQYPMYFMGAILAGFVIGFWTLYSSVCYLAISYKLKGEGKQKHLYMAVYYHEWTVFFTLVHIGTIAILGVALKRGWEADVRLQAICITCIVGCGISVLLTLGGLFGLPDCLSTLGLPIEPPKKKFVVAAFKSHGCVILFLSMHQIAWALAALIVPEFGGTEHGVRIAAFVVGGLVNPLLAMVSAALCFKIVRFTKKPKERSRVMTKTMMEIHAAWIWVFLAINIAGHATYGSCFGTLKDEHGDWTITAPFMVVVCHVLSLIGNILIGYLCLAVVHYSKFQDKLGMTTPVKPKTTQQASTSNNTTRGATAKKTAKPAAPKPAPKKASSTTSGTSNNNTRATTSPGATGLSTGPPATSPGATGASSAVAGTSSGRETNIDEIKERNRLLQEEVSLQLQLKELREQQQQAPNQSVLYTGNTVHLGPNAPPMPPIYTVNPPSYEEVTSKPNNC